MKSKDPKNIIKPTSPEEIEQRGEKGETSPLTEEIDKREPEEPEAGLSERPKPLLKLKHDSIPCH